MIFVTVSFRACMVFSAADPHLVLLMAIVVILESGDSHLVAVRVHGGQDVDAGGVDESLNALVTQQVL